VITSKGFHPTSGTEVHSGYDLDETVVVSRNTSLRHEHPNIDTSARAAETAPRNTITLVIREMRQRLVLVENQSVLLGRNDPDERWYPDVDLTVYGAYGRGVSHQHLRLTLHHGQVYVTDLRSRNGTQLNGQALPPDVPCPIHSGDSLQLGRLAIQVLFS
jgi:pSer/pThr/pTyr-binding forkhead associated (FHA) protein